MPGLNVVPDGEGERRGDEHEELGEPDGVGPHGQPVTRADGLGDYFSCK